MNTIPRREFMSYFSAIGLSGTLFPGVLWSRMQQEKITKEMIAQAEVVAGITLTDADREMMVEGLNRNAGFYKEIRAVPLPNSVAPAIKFDPVVPGMHLSSIKKPFRPMAPPVVKRPERLEDVAFWPVTKLAALIRTKQVSSVELTNMYIERLKKFGDQLQCVVTLTEDRAKEQAERADRQLAAGVYHGPLHGIPWGAKDLLAVNGYPTTWGTKPYIDQKIEVDATVVKRLGDAGAVLVAKLTLGELAMGDVWYGGQTKNPWKLDQGSSGSSAGPASATAAGLVGFSIGSETLGSISAPSTRCGVTGLRPTFGRVSRAGAMALSWSMDKLGPICRSVEDCALILRVIQGKDNLDPTVYDMPLNYDATTKPASLRVGYIKSAFDATENHATKPFDDAALEVLQKIGAKLIEVELPSEYPIAALRIILNAEAGAAFDELTRSEKIKDMKRQEANAWPNSFRVSQLTPAVEYINANRVRALVMKAMAETMKNIDVLVTPTTAPNQLVLTNMTGNPAVIIPNGFNEDGTPVSLTFLGKLFGEAEALELAKAYQDATEFHTKTPEAFA